jgi:benzil reductase ((S)-benzoin forming)
MNHIIITGHSKGLGEGITLALLDENHHIHGISRTDNQHLQRLAKAKGCQMDFYSCDLSHIDTIETVLQQVFNNIPVNASGVYLINNAGVINPIGPLQTLNPLEIDTHLRINLMAPIYLTHGFIKYTQQRNMQKRILNISSGAANNPYYGWSAYCTAKAGLDMLTRCVATEQEKQPYPVEIMSVAPGVIDTDMQTIIRDTTDEQFSLRKKFIDLKEKGQLIAPNLAGKKLVDLLFSRNFKSGDISDIRGSY